MLYMSHTYSTLWRPLDTVGYILLSSVKVVCWANDKYNILDWNMEYQRNVSQNQLNWQIKFTWSDVQKIHRSNTQSKTLDSSYISIVTYRKYAVNIIYIYINIYSTTTTKDEKQPITIYCIVSE